MKIDRTLGLRIEKFSRNCSDADTDLAKDDFYAYSRFFYLFARKRSVKNTLRGSFHCNFFLRLFLADFFFQTWYESEGTLGECCGIFLDFSVIQYDLEMSFENSEEACRLPFFRAGKSKKCSRVFNSILHV